jgi:hypothetical protein
MVNMAENVEFRKALKHGAKLRLAICGPSGSGKTYTLLRLATDAAVARTGACAVSYGYVVSYRDRNLIDRDPKVRGGTVEDCRNRIDGQQNRRLVQNGHDPGGNYTRIPALDAGPSPRHLGVLSHESGRD